MSDGVIIMVYMLLSMFNNMISTSNCVMSMSDSKTLMYDCAILQQVHKGGKIKVPDFANFFLFSSNGVILMCNSVISMSNSLIWMSNKMILTFNRAISMSNSMIPMSDMII